MAGADLNWDDLRYLLRAIEAKTLAGAARKMRVEHTTIGRRISALERSLGAPLVFRGPDGLKLTPLGEQIAPLDHSDLTGHELIGYDASLSAVPAAKWIEDRATKATIVLRSREMTDMLTAALSGVGLAALPCMFGDSEPALKRLTPEVIATRK